MSVTPRPEFGKPETGQVRHWFRTDAQMRRHYLSTEAREIERQRISERRRQMRQYRAEHAESERRATHQHFTCPSCVHGLEDVGIFGGKDGTEQRTPRAEEALTCCTCLALVPLGPRWSTVPTRKGPNYHAFRCRVFDPDSGPVEMEATDV